jgi:hypothetical protein
MEEKVNQAIAEGWEPIGSVTVMHDVAASQIIVLFQAMIR